MCLVVQCFYCAFSMAACMHACMYLIINNHFFLFAVGPPQTKKPKYLSGDTKPYCSNNPSALEERDLNKTGEIPAYHHWLALQLKKKFEEDLAVNFTLDEMPINVPEGALNTIVEQLSYFPGRTFQSEYEFTSLLCRHMDRFLFDGNHCNEGAVLSQFPLEITRRCDLAIVFFDEMWAPRFPVAAASDAKLTDLAKAESESRLYSVCGASRCEKNAYFHFLYSLPCSKSCIQLEMHLIVSKKLHFIKICEAEFWNKKQLKKFLILVYGLIRWTFKHDKDRHSSKPRGIVPLKGLELFENLNIYRPKVFLKGNVVYKICDKGEPNLNAIRSLEYMESAKTVHLSQGVYLLSYNCINGDVKPSRVEQFESLGKLLDQLHSKGLVHGDVRETNLIFGEGDNAYLIDFDYLSDVDSVYCNNYNGGLPERHPDAKNDNRMLPDHDWHSLIYIFKSYFGCDHSVEHCPLLSSHLDMVPYPC